MGDDEHAAVGVLLDDLVQTLREPVRGRDRVLPAGEVVGHGVGEEGGNASGNRSVISAEVRPSPSPKSSSHSRASTSSGRPAASLHACAVMRARLSVDDQTRRGRRSGPHRELSGLLQPSWGERDVAAAGVAVLRVPHGLAMADEDEVGHRDVLSRACVAASG